jgi:small-conductance mechanosensitive channel
VRRAAHRTGDVLWSSLSRRCRRPFRVTLLLAAVLIALRDAGLPARATELVRQLCTICLIAAVAWLVIQLAGVVEDVAFAHLDINKRDNRRARRLRTQINVLRRVVDAVIVFIAVAAELTAFPSARALGASLLASAGVASVVAGLAAQATLANLIAGLQIALTDSIRIDDVVVVNDEWGRIEEITLTYVVVRTWDNRRLVLPVSWFTSNVFQNWTRRESWVLGTVLLHGDFTMPVPELREELHRIVRESPLWDGRAWVLQVVDSTPTTMVLRALVSSEDAPTNWDLRCDVREKLLAFLEERHPRSLPNVRIVVADGSGTWHRGDGVP